jgi:peptidoglycan hydrolase-like protein with peptidoglycan-binding domain
MYGTSPRLLLGAVAAALSALLGACAAPPSRQDDVKVASSSRISNTPQRNITDFTDGLRCMDETFLRYNTRDVSVILEDLADTTKKVSAGARDMMISAISDMTRRSRAVQVITFGQDANNVVAFLNNARQRTAFGVVPQYNIRGSITQLDEGVLRRQSDLGVSLEPIVSAGVSRSRQFNALGLDVSIAQTSNLALLPGVSSKNIVVLAKEGDALDSQATIRKVGINFSTNFQRTDGTAQALRNMVELSAIELFGRLLKLPYWSCLGVGPDNADVKREIEDWFIGMDRAGELVPYFQEQLRNRGFFDGPIDGQVTPGLRQAIVAYRRASGFAELDFVDLPFFSDFLHRPFPPPPAKPFAADTVPLAQRAAPAAAPAPAPAPTAAPRPAAQPAPAAAASARRLLLIPTQERYRAGEAVGFYVIPSMSGYLYCYHQDQTGVLRRIFPNRFTHDPRVKANVPLTLPGAVPMELRARAGTPEAVGCFTTPREIYSSVPAALRWGDFDPLKLTSFDEVAAIFGPIAKGDIARAQFTIVAGQ